MTEEGLERVRRATSFNEIDAVAAGQERCFAACAVGAAVGASILGVLQITNDLVEAAPTPLPAIVGAVGVFILMLALGALAGATAGLLVEASKTDIRRRRLLRWADAEAWRPREGMRHPRGRVDTEPRWILERRLNESEVEIGLRRWTYEPNWEGGRPVWRPRSLLAVRRFTADELDEADTYASDRDGLVAVAERERRLSVSPDPARDAESEERRLERGNERLLAAWVSERGTEVPIPERETLGDLEGASRS